jgi:predicted ATPase
LIDDTEREWSVAEELAATKESEPQRIGPYVVEGILGSGGMGLVYRARAPDGTKVAVKVVTGRLSAHMRDRFAREAAVRLEHPNIVRVLGAEVEGETPYIVFELLEGEPLETRLGAGPMQPEEAVAMAIQIGRALSCAHGRGVVHRDLKPANVFILKDGTPKLVDFGIAYLVDQTRLTITGFVMGTPAYLSPEQARGDDECDERTDVWGLGAILYHALSGRPPFVRASSLATIVAVLLDPVEPVRAAAPAVSHELSQVVHRALAKSPEERWSSIDAMVGALERLSFGEQSIVDLEQIDGAVNLRERRIVAILLARGVRDRPAIERAVEAQGGALVPVMGQMALGLFGVERWTGDEVAQAIEVGLEIRSAAEHVAVASGHAARAGNRISGAALSAAERCCDARLPDLAVDPEAMRIAAGRFHFVELLPGVFGVRARVRDTMFDTGPARSGRTPLVGREVELAQIKRALAQALHDRRARALLLYGPAGIGKNRLRNEALSEFLRATQGTTAHLLAARAQRHQARAALSTFRTAMLNRAAHGAETWGWPRIAQEATLGERQHAIHTLVGEAIEEPKRALASAEFIGDLLGVPMPESEELAAARADVRLMKDRTRLAVRDYVEGLLREGPLGIFFEEIQWCDRDSREILDELLDRNADEPLAIMLTSREAEEMGEAVSRIELEGLAMFEVAELAGHLAKRRLPDTLVARLFERTGGNPLFVEQIVQELVDQNHVDDPPHQLPLPLTVEAAVQSRLDHLPGEERSLLEWLSIFGREITPAEASLYVPRAEPLLQALIDRGILARSGKQAKEEALIRFRNQLLADVAYGMINSDVREELHRRAAGYLAARSSADPAELARHYELGGAAVLAAKHYAFAALLAARKGDSLEVVDHADAALRLGRTHEGTFALLMAKNEALQFLGRAEEQDEVLERALLKADSPLEEARALTELASLLTRAGKADDALKLAERAVAAARTSQAREPLVLALGKYALALIALGRLEEAEEKLAESTASSALCPVHVRAVNASWRAQLARARGDLSASMDAFAEAKSLYEATGDVRRSAGAEVNLADGYNRVGAFSEAAAALRSALEKCRRVRNRVMEGYALLNLGYSCAMQRDPEAASHLEAARHIAEEVNHPRLDLSARMYRARLGLLTQPEVRWLQLAEQTADEAKKRGILFNAVGASWVASRLALALGDKERALLRANDAVALLGEMGAIEEDELEVLRAHADALEANGLKESAEVARTRAELRKEEMAAAITDPELLRRFLAYAG